MTNYSSIVSEIVLQADKEIEDLKAQRQEGRDLIKDYDAEVQRLKKELRELKEKVQCVVPYVVETLPGRHVKKEWPEVHGARARSSVSQLNMLLRAVEK